MRKQKVCKKINIKPGSIKKIKKLLNVMDDINRLRILSLFKKYKELCVCDIFNTLNLRQNLVSYHLRVLHQAGLVMSERRGGNVYYKEDKKNIIKTLDSINRLFS